ncbi:MAG: hypothetical protein Q7T86_03115 [Hyphomicrobiaceae bacterium]|nr:hypothetical protein [Hyphomicrobiaceae bacterium]
MPEPSFLDRLAASGEGYREGGIVGALTAPFMAPDRAVEAKRQAQAQTNQTYQALTGKMGFAPEEAMLLVQDKKLLNDVLTSKMKQPERELKEIFNEKTGRKQLASVDKMSGSYIPVGGEEAQGGGGISGPYKDLKQKADVEEGLRKEITAVNKDWPVIRDAANKIKLAANDPSAAGDMALIFGYMKLLDPASVVRETEYANAENARGVPEGIRNVWKRVLEGERLSDGQRKDFLNQAGKIANAQAERYRQSLKSYDEVGKRLEVDTRNVILENPDDVGGRGQLLDDAVDAIAKGADRTAVLKRLQESGVNPEGLGKRLFARRGAQ